MEENKRHSYIRQIFLTGLICSFIYVSEVFAYQKLSCIMHLHSNFSHGVSHSLEDLVLRARQKNIDVIIPTDHVVMSWIYGPVKYFRILSVKNEFDSVIKKGPEKYLYEIAKLRIKYPDIIIISGIESTPYYWWSGSLPEQNLTINDWHRHMLIVGMENPGDYRMLPLSGISEPGEFDIIMLWPAVFVIFGFVLFKKKKFPAFLLLTAGLVALFGNYPFETPKYEPHRPIFDNNRPYQEAIDYVGSKNALTFWAHPEATNWENPRKIENVFIKTMPYPNVLMRTKDYTGFAIFPEGYRKVGSVGGVWDDVLEEYCRGKRKKPVWAVSEVDYGEGYKGDIDSCKNIVWVVKKNKNDVIDGLKNGSFYALWRSAEWEMTLEDFYVESGDERAIFGGRLQSHGAVKIFMDIKTSDDLKRQAKIYIIKDGDVVNSMEAEIPGKFFYDRGMNEKISDSSENRPMSYYRVFIDAGYPNYLATNPVFVENNKVEGKGKNRSLPAT